MEPFFSQLCIKYIFSSPEPKAQGEVLWSLTLRRRRRPSVRPSVHNL